MTLLTTTVPDRAPLSHPRSVIDGEPMLPKSEDWALQRHLRRLPQNELSRAASDKAQDALARVASGSTIEPPAGSLTSLAIAQQVVDRRLTGPEKLDIQEMHDHVKTLAEQNNASSGGQIQATAPMAEIGTIPHEGPAPSGPIGFGVGGLPH